MMQHFLGDTEPPTFRATFIEEATKYSDPTGAQDLKIEFKRRELTTTSTRQAFGMKYKLGVVVCLLSSQRGEKVKGQKSTLSAIRNPYSSSQKQ
jgi:hypothetical protein